MTPRRDDCGTKDYSYYNHTVVCILLLYCPWWNVPGISFFRKSDKKRVFKVGLQHFNCLQTKNTLSLIFPIHDTRTVKTNLHQIY